MLATKCNLNVGSDINTTLKSDTFGSSLDTIRRSHANENNCEYPIIKVVNINNANATPYDRLESQTSDICKHYKAKKQTQTLVEYAGNAYCTGYAGTVAALNCDWKCKHQLDTDWSTKTHVNNPQQPTNMQGDESL